MIQSALPKHPTRSLLFQKLISERRKGWFWSAGRFFKNFISWFLCLLSVPRNGICSILKGGGFKVWSCGSRRFQRERRTALFLTPSSTEHRKWMTNSEPPLNYLRYFLPPRALAVYEGAELPTSSSPIGGVSGNGSGNSLPTSSRKNNIRMILMVVIATHQRPLKTTSDMTTLIFSTGGMHLVPFLFVQKLPLVHAFLGQWQKTLQWSRQ